jgi:hypothetical protein
MGKVAHMAKRWGLQPKFSNIERLSLVKQNRWVNWRAKKQPDGRVGKQPMMPTLRTASVNKPDTWSSFKAVVAGYEEHDELSGVGIVLTDFPRDITVIDLDKCYNPIDGPEEWAQELIDAAGTYAEVSPSERGLRLIMFGDAGAFINNDKGVEVYTQASGRFVTITGHVLAGSPNIRHAVTKELVDELEQYRPEDKGESSQDPMEDTPYEIEQVLLELVKRDPELVHYKPWLDLGMGLHHQFDGGPEGLEMWHKVCESLPNYEPDELDHKWDSFQGGGRVLTLRTMYDRAKDKGITIRPHHKPVSPDDFPDLDDDEDQGVSESVVQFEDPPRLSVVQGSGLLSLGQLARQSPPKQIIEDLLARKQTSQISGEPGAGKTFLAMELAHAVASGQEVFGRRTVPGSVLYLPYEGVSAMAQRVRAWKIRRRRLPDNFHVATSMPSLADQSEWVRWLAPVFLQAGRPSLVVIDTLAASMPGVNSSDEERMGAMVSTLRTLAEKYDCHVCHIHHPPKGGALTGQKSRGSGVIEGDLDSQIWVTKTDGIARQWEVTKQRGLGSYGASGKFALKTVETAMVTDFGQERAAYLDVDVTETDSHAPELVELSGMVRDALRECGNVALDAGQYNSIVQQWLGEHWPSGSVDQLKKHKSDAKSYLGAEFALEVSGNHKVKSLAHRE